MLAKYWERCPSCGSHTLVDVDSVRDASMPPDGASVICFDATCKASGEVAYMGEGDHFCQWGRL
jgi:hypothetical protein